MCALPSFVYAENEAEAEPVEEVAAEPEQPEPAPVVQPEPAAVVVEPVVVERPPLGRDAAGPVVAEAEAEAAVVDEGIRSEFIFGSYGRVRAATDLQGSTARPVNVVTYGSRIDEVSYAELEFRQRFLTPERNTSTFHSEVVATLAFLDDFFHYTGRFEQSLAMRNLYAELGWAGGLVDVSLWGGSRMYRGDDVYLLDFWPLDNLNTVGGGTRVAMGQDFGRTEIKVHAGVNRLVDPYQLQVVRVPGIEFGADDVVFLDRQRFIVSGRAEQQLWLAPQGRTGLKLAVYGESQHLPEGTQRLADGVNERTVPEDDGWLIGTQLGFWTAGEGLFAGSFANLFVRYASDLAAYGEFGIPYGVNLEETSQGASELLVALSGNLETPWAGLLVGAYFKDFATAGRESTFRDYWETIVAARVHAYVTRHIHPGVEISHQVRQHGGPFPETESYSSPRFEVPAVTKLSFIQAFSMEPSMYSRPQLRLIYTASMLNESAQRSYRPQDPRRELDVQHYLGVMVEWWFNSASY